MKRIRLTVAYDGTDYCGFQVQPQFSTIEGVLNKALCLLTGEKIEVIGASRTDSGVHSHGNIAVFDTESTIPAERFFLALNPLLPDDVCVVSSCEVPQDWHPRKQDCMKTYSYKIMNSQIEDPIVRRYSMHFGRPLDLSLMRCGAKKLVGTHDFTSFANPSSQILKEGGSPVRTIKSIEISAQKGFFTGFDGNAKGASDEKKQNGLESGEKALNGLGFGEKTLNGLESGEKALNGLVTITVTGDGFLYNMVRIIAGTLIDVGTGRFAPDDIMDMLGKRDRRAAGMTAEAKGLTLERIEYPDETN